MINNCLRVDRKLGKSSLWQGNRHNHCSETIISIHLRSEIGKHHKRVLLQSTPKHIAEVSTDKRQVQERKISIQAKVVATEAYRNS